QQHEALDDLLQGLVDTQQLHAVGDDADEEAADHGALDLADAAPADAVVVEDVPLLVETGAAPGYPLVVVVEAPEEERVRRLV
ncbi:dephospho-CoA kinase, partial [Kineococcus sp. T13]|nr:dephospho-CoA kinase [Kineococcus vitellinus]